MKRLATLAGMVLAAALGSLALPSVASATPTCTAYNDGSPGSFPADGTHMQVCFATATNPDKATIATAVRAIPRKGASGPLQAYDQVKAAGATIFFFANSADAVSYLQNTAPYNAYPPYATAATSGRCGFTAALANGSDIVTGVFKTCQYGSTMTPATGTNPDLDHTVKHEMGHAFDLAMGVVNGGTVPSAKTGFSGSTSPPNYLLDGLNKLTPSNWSTMTPTQKASTVCAIFSTIKFSPLERALIIQKGGTDPDPTNVGKSVCVGSAIDTPFVGMTPTQIAQTIAPYFTLDSREAWAEIFARNLPLANPPAAPGFLQLTDRIFITPRYNCANLDVTKYSTTSLPPLQADINSHSCSFTPFDL